MLWQRKLVESAITEDDNTNEYNPNKRILINSSSMFLFDWSLVPQVHLLCQENKFPSLRLPGWNGDFLLEPEGLEDSNKDINSSSLSSNGQHLRGTTSHFGIFLWHETLFWEIFTIPFPSLKTYLLNMAYAKILVSNTISDQINQGFLEILIMR